MSQQGFRIVPTFPLDEQAWLRRSSIPVPKFWEGHSVAPVAGDVVRVGGRQFLVQGRAWEHDGQGALLRVFLGSSHAESDTVFG